MPEANPITEGAYLTDANYHRLGYQLAAQLMHRETAVRKRESFFDTALDILYGEREGLAPRGDAARRRAMEFAADAEAVVLRFRKQRETKRWLVLRGRLSPREERLEEFLCRTVLPCLTILIAASTRETDPREAERQIAPLRRRAETGETVGHLEGVSYRTLYNLACYEAGERTAGVSRQAVAYLAAALEEAPGSRRQELGRWAVKDPSLAPLKGDPGFEELTAPYA